MRVSPKTYYDRMVAENRWVYDAAHLPLISALDSLFWQLYHMEYSFLARLKRFISWEKKITGLYIHGGVGVGKTYLMDVFYELLPISRKKRMHFHAFMRWIHQALQSYQGTKNPIQEVIRTLKKDVKLLCLDEFIVADIADAMILERLLDALAKEKICLVTTSNLSPDHLYARGLQRARFLPAIHILKKENTIISIDTTDYRMQKTMEQGVYFYPLNPVNQEKMRQQFHRFAHHGIHDRQPIMILDRMIQTNAYANGVIWFDFNHLTLAPRSKLDYLEIAQQFNTVLISEIPDLNTVSPDQVLSFIYLIDIFYDHGVNTIILAALPLESLYTKGAYLFDFARTKSRLNEMATSVYLHKAHKPYEI